MIVRLIVRRSVRHLCVSESVSSSASSASSIDDSESSELRAGGQKRGFSKDSRQNRAQDRSWVLTPGYGDSDTGSPISPICSQSGPRFKVSVPGRIGKRGLSRFPIGTGRIGKRGFPSPFPTKSGKTGSGKWGFGGLTGTGSGTPGGAGCGAGCRFEPKKTAFNLHVI
jgi:hypothetical protein